MSAAYEYGVTLATLQHGLRTMMQEIARGFADAGKVLNNPRDPKELLEVEREDRYQRRLERERRLGLSYVDRIVKEKRKELGLDEVVPLRRGNSR